MDYLFSSLWELLPLPILIGMFIWIFSLCLFSLFLIVTFLLFHQSSSKMSKIIPKKEFPKEETEMKSVFSCDSLSLISAEKTQKDFQKEKKCFYLENDAALKKGSISPLPLIKLRSLMKNENRPTNSLTHRSIIKDLNSFTNSLKETNLHQSIDSLFSKDSLIQ